MARMALRISEAYEYQIDRTVPESSTESGGTFREDWQFEGNTRDLA